MKKLTDQELDELFRAAADGLHPAYEPAAWDSMVQLLDRPKASLWRPWMTFTIFGLVTFSVGVWVGTELFSNSNAFSGASKVMNTEVSSSVSDQHHVQHIENLTPFTDSAKNLIGEPHTEKPVNIAQKSGFIRKPVFKQNDSEFSLSQMAEQPENVPYSFQQNNQRFNTIAPVFIADENELDSLSALHPKSEYADSLEQQATILPSDSIGFLEQEQIILPNKTLVADRFSIRAQFSPDFSSIEFSSPTRVGSNFGVMIDYFINARWSFATGLLKSKKSYFYQGEINYGTQVANDLDGSCSVLDIPLNAYYIFRLTPKTSWSAGLGVSSYLMLREDYTYTVHYGTKSRDYTTSISNENNEWFKMLNVSVLYRYRISSHVSIIAEPFLKAPFSGVGEGSVLLSSSGIFLGASYKIK